MARVDHLFRVHPVIILRVLVALLVAFFGFGAYDLQHTEMVQYQAAFGECIRVNYLRAQTNENGVVAFIALSGAARQDPQVAARYNALIRHLVATDFTNCNRAVNNPHGFEPPIPILIGRGDHLSPQANRIYTTTNRILQSSNPFKTIEHLYP
jgi:hypothetical protein